MPHFPDLSSLTYHENVIELEIAETPSVAAVTAALAGSIGAGLAGLSVSEQGASFDPVFSVLSELERNGEVVAVSPLGARKKKAAQVSEGAIGLAAAFGKAAFRKLTNQRLGAERSVSMLLTLKDDRRIDKVIDALRKDRSVVSASRVPIRYLCATGPAAVPPIDAQWHLARIEWDAARKSRRWPDTAGVKVGVLDTGLDFEHPDIAVPRSRSVWTYPGQSVPTSEKDFHGHGTHVAGVVAALGAGPVRVTGIVPCELRAWKIFSDRPTYVPEFGQFVYLVDPDMYLNALIDAAEAGMDAINLSIGGGAPPSPREAAAFSELAAAGCTVVAAMGNERAHGSPTSYPAAIGGVVAVGATGPRDEVANFSNRGPHISISAPGVGIWSTLPTYPGQTGFEAVPKPGGQVAQGKPIWRETEYADWDGTSMATPIVAGAAAIAVARLRIAGKGTDPASVRALLVQAVDKPAAMKGQPFTQDHGFGRINLRKLVEMTI